MWSGWVTLLGAVTFAGCASAGGEIGDGSAPRAAAPEQRSVLEGVFTADQADRGQQVFQRVCSGCHTAANFSGVAFQRFWTDRPVGELYESISTLMPLSDPGSLSDAEYTDVVTYILKTNGFPAGATELPADREAMDRVVFERAR